MDAFAPQSIRTDRASSRATGIAEAAILTLALWVSLMAIPRSPDASLDGSWQEMLIHARTHGIQFGRELIFTWGPWGFLCSLYHLGTSGALPILLWETAGQLLVALSLVLLTRQLSLWRRLAFAVLFLGFHQVFLDVSYFVLIALVVISGMMGRDVSPARLVGWAIVLGFLAQFKFTYLVIASCGVLAAVVCWGGRRSWRRAGAVAAAYAAAVVGAWVAAGQNPDNLYPYLRRSLEIASGYGDAMGVDEPWPVFVCGSGLAIACTAFLLTAWRRMPERAFATGACGYLAVSLLVMWKESFTRADLVPLGGHALGFFTYVVILAPAVVGLLFPGRRWHWFDLAIPGCLAAVACFDPQFYTLGPGMECRRCYANAKALGRLGALTREWQRSYEDACARQSLPLMRAAVGDRTIDVYDYNLGVAFLNGFTVDSRPVFQGYTAYTPGLEGWNLRHYQSGRAPDFLIWSDQRIDNRYPGQDDATLVAALPGSYEPLFQEGGYWLLRRIAPVSKLPVERRLLFKGTARLSDEIALPPGREHAVWLQADAVPNNLGRLRAVLYKPAAINIAVTDDQGRQRVWRLLPRIARDGILLVPTLETADDAASFLRGEALSRVESFHFEAPADQQEFWSRVEVSIFELTGISLRFPPGYKHLVDLGFFEHPPVSMTSAFPPEIFGVSGERAIVLHAESEVVLGVPAGSTRLTLGFGIREGAYTGDGHTAGVRFSLEVVWASGRREGIWNRYLDPVWRREDRGTQRLDLAVPGGGPVQVVLHMAPAIAGDNRWDWSYLTSMRLDGPDSR